MFFTELSVVVLSTRQFHSNTDQHFVEQVCCWNYSRIKFYKTPVYLAAVPSGASVTECWVYVTLVLGTALAVGWRDDQTRYENLVSLSGWENNTTFLFLFLWCCRSRILHGKGCKFIQWKSSTGTKKKEQSSAKLFLTLHRAV